MSSLSPCTLDDRIGHAEIASAAALSYAYRAIVDFDREKGVVRNRLSTMSWLTYAVHKPITLRNWLGGRLGLAGTSTERTLTRSSGCTGVTESRLVLALLRLD